MRYILWAIPRGSSDRLDERPMTSFPLTSAQADKVEAVAARDGWHGFRRVEDTNAAPDFVGAVRRVAEG